MQKKKSLLGQGFEIKGSVGSQETDDAAKDELYPPNPFRDKSGKLIGKFVDHYEKRSKHNRVMRIIFFSLSFFALLVIIGVCSVVSILAAAKETINVEAVVAIIGAGATMLTSILVLPKMVGRNLFPDKEDKEILKFVKDMNKTELGFMKVRNHAGTDMQEHQNLQKEKGLDS